ncbi:MAG: hypothetical protein WC569_02400 [Candidatus Omnitrophota bacterium]
MSELVRVWKEIETDDISHHLLIVGESTGDCSNCRELGINYSMAKVCPKCGSDFKYIASRTREIRKIKNRRPDLIFIELEDYKRATGKIKAKNLFFSKE